MRHVLSRFRAQVIRKTTPPEALRRSLSSRCREPPATSSRRLSGFRVCSRSPGKTDALLIADEMITGFGRTGNMFGCNHTGITPDIITIGKGMGNGFPVSATYLHRKDHRQFPLCQTEFLLQQLRRQSPWPAPPHWRPSAPSSRNRWWTTPGRSGNTCLKVSPAFRKNSNSSEMCGAAGLLIGVELVKDRRAGHRWKNP